MKRLLEIREFLSYTQRLMKTFILAALTVLVVACGGGGGGANLSPATFTGVFLDSPVEGMTYQSGSNAPGTTDANGTFVYTPGESLIFSVGGVELGTLANGAAVISPLNFGDAWLNIARFLQTLDADGDPTNGIDIAAAGVALAGTMLGDAVFLSDATTFENDIGPVLDIALGSGAVLIDAATAREHLVTNVLGPPAFIGRLEDEVEPNDSISTANPIALPSLPSNPAVLIGFSASGAISNLTDGVDTYSFTAARTRTYVFDLCASTATACGQFNLDVGIAYFNVLDQFGNVLLSTQDDDINGNHGELSINAGVLYYVMIIAENTMNGVQLYEQHAVENFR